MFAICHWDLRFRISLLSLFYRYQPFFVPLIKFLLQWKNAVEFFCQVVRHLICVKTCVKSCPHLVIKVVLYNILVIRGTKYLWPYLATSHLFPFNNYKTFRNDPLLYSTIWPSILSYKNFIHCSTASPAQLVIAMYKVVIWPLQPKSCVFCKMQ